MKNKFLLDTHIFVDLVAKRKVAELDTLQKGELFLSEISAAELACLSKLGRLNLHLPAEVWFDTAVRKSGVKLIPVTPHTWIRSVFLDWDHRDPADRIMIQCLIDDPNLILCTRDKKVSTYARKLRLNTLQC